MNNAPPAATATYNSGETECVSQAVVTAVADAKNVATVDVTPPLYHVIDPDALETVVASLTSRPDEPVGQIEFSYSGYTITVTGNGQVTATPDEHQG